MSTFLQILLCSWIMYTQRADAQVVAPTSDVPSLVCYHCIGVDTSSPVLRDIVQRSSMNRYTASCQNFSPGQEPAVEPCGNICYKAAISAIFSIGGEAMTDQSAIYMRSCEYIEGDYPEDTALTYENMTSLPMTSRAINIMAAHNVTLAENALGYLDTCQMDERKVTGSGHDFDLEEEDEVCNGGRLYSIPLREESGEAAEESQEEIAGGSNKIVSNVLQQLGLLLLCYALCVL